MLAARVASLVSRFPRTPSNGRRKRGKTTASLRTSHPKIRQVALRIHPVARAVEAPRYAALLLFIVCASLTGARATAGEPESRFSEATAAFHAGDFPRALLLYEQCVQLGMQGPAVHFNIGVAAYRSGDYARAERAFREVARTPAMAQIAYYNLGLVELKREDEKAARAWFERAAREPADEKIAALAAQRLDEQPKPRAGSPWSYYARAGIGYDDNVALRSESIETPGIGKDDSFAEVLAAGSYSFLPSWRIDGAAGLMRYSDLDEFDQAALSLGVARGFEVDSWYFEIGGYATQLSLGGDVYERSGAAAAQAWRTFAGFGTLRGQLRWSSIDGDGDFSGLSGSRTELDVQYDWAWSALNFSAHASTEINDSDDDIFATRWVEIGGVARWDATPLWSFSADVRLRRTRHPDQPEVQEGWEDKRQSYRLEATRALWKDAQLWLRFGHERNASPVDAYEYNRNWVAASIEVWR